MSWWFDFPRPHQPGSPAFLAELFSQYEAQAGDWKDGGGRQGCLSSAPFLLAWSYGPLPWHKALLSDHLLSCSAHQVPVPPHTHTHACAHMPLQAEGSNCPLLLLVSGYYTSPVGFLYLTHTSANHPFIKSPCKFVSVSPAPPYTHLSAHVQRVNA